MRYLVVAVFLAILFFGYSAKASVEGDPFAEADMFASLPASEPEEDLQLGGYLEFRNQVAIKNLEEPISIRQRLRLEASWEREAFSFFGNIDADQELAAATWKGDGHQIWHAGIHEAYFMYDTDRMDLFLGRKIHRWGTGDGINPMDLINPLDILDPISTGRSDNRQPVFMGGGSVLLGDWSLEGVFLPVAAVNGLPRSGNPWEPRALKVLRTQEKQGLFMIESAQQPDRWFQDVEYGGRLSTMSSGWDIALMFFHGYADNPVFSLENVGGGTRLIPKYQRSTAYGVAFAKGLESNTLRGELAWKPETPYQDPKTGLPVRRDLFQSVLGWDYDFEGKHYFNIQAFADVYGAASIQTQWQYGLTYELSSKLADDAFSFGVRGKYYLEAEGAITEFFTDYAMSDNWKILSGVMLWTGPDDSILGQYGDNDSVYCTIRYTF
jgi:hypothetical protein